ncbi:ABC transporter permease [Neobacillus muris]|uniref:ABC transporter permease n=1 Tax=Neobacillus muris TaxID=2941334 RepID=UPI00203F287D|nr:ABC transporter permease [Neobacillus muris]
MSFWWLAWKDLKMIARDKKALLTLILMPLILIAILGSAFGNVMKQDDDSVLEKFSMGIVNLDKGPLSKVLVEEVFENQMKDQIEIKSLHESELRKKITEHHLPVGLIIEPGFSDSLMTGEQAKVKLLTVPDPGLKAVVVQKVVEQFADSVPIEAAAAQKASLVQTGTDGEKKTLQEMDLSKVSLLNETTVSAKTKMVGSFQYYAAAMGVMFLLMTVVQGVSNMILEREQEVYNRLLLTHLTYTYYLLGKLLGLVVICLAQAAVILMGTGLIFGVDWGDSASGVLVMTMAFIINACGLGVLAGSFVKTEKAFSVAGMFGTQIMAVLGGSMVPMYLFPDWVNSAVKFLPNALALQNYLKLMTGAGLADILPAVLGALGLGILFFVIGLIRLSMGRRGRYA